MKRRVFLITIAPAGALLAVAPGPLAALETLRGAATWAEHDLLPDEDSVGDFLRAGPHDDLDVLTEAIGRIADYLETLRA